MILPKELISIVEDYLFSDLTEDYWLIMRPARLYQCVWEHDEMFVIPCQTQ